MLGFLRPDGKSQVTIEYDGDKPVRASAVVATGRSYFAQRSTTRFTSAAFDGARVSRYQRRLPAADSITPMTCQRPGGAWGKAWSRPRGSTSGRSLAAKTTPEVPRVKAMIPG